MVIALSILPFLVARNPLMVDYPAHLASIAVMLNAGSGWAGDQFYWIQWAPVGNLGTDLICYLLAMPFGIEPAGRIVTAAIPALTMLGLWRLSRALAKPSVIGILLAAPLAYSEVFTLGFMNYCLALALALLAFAAWLEKDWPRWVFAPIALALWLCHVAGWGVFCVMVGGAELSQSRDVRHLLKRLWPPALPALLLPFLIQHTHSESNVDWLNNKARAWLDVLLASNFTIDILALIGLLFTIYVGLRSRQARVDWRSALPAVLLSAMTLVFPSDFADARLVIPALMLLCLSLDWPTNPRLNLVVGAAFAARMLVITANWAQGSAQLERSLAALDQVPNGARIINVVAEDRTKWNELTYHHLASYAVVRKGALVNSNFVMPGLHLLRMREDPLFSDPSQRVLVQGNTALDLRRLNSLCCEYVWAMSGSPRQFILPANIQTLYQDQYSVLGRRVVAVPAAKARQKAVELSARAEVAPNPAAK